MQYSSKNSEDVALQKFTDSIAGIHGPLDVTVAIQMFILLARAFFAIAFAIEKVAESGEIIARAVYKR